jgi:hypothetical protein
MFFDKVDVYEDQAVIHDTNQFIPIGYRIHVINCDGLKFNLKQATKAQRGSRGIALLFLQPQR